MTIGYQGEPESYSHLASGELFPGMERVGYGSFPLAFAALHDGLVDRLVLPIENSTTGSILPVLDCLVDGDFHIVGEHLVEVQHAVLAVQGATMDTIERVLSHPEALNQAQSSLSALGWEPEPVHDTAGAVRLVAESGDPTQAALARAGAADAHGLVVLRESVIDRDHNTTRFVVLEPGPAVIGDNADKTSIAFEVSGHRAGSLALALTELGLRGANLTRIESRPAGAAWTYRFFIDLRHPPGPAGFTQVFEPELATLTSLHHLGSYLAKGPAAPSS